MDVREKLVELLHKGVRCPGVIDNCNDCPYYSFEKACDEFGATVDLLIANGVTVQECKLGVKKTNADRIRSMSDEELAEFIRSMVDGSNSHNVACYGCINYGTHHSDPANKGTYLYECEGCTNEGIGLDVLMWLQQPAEEG